MHVAQAAEQTDDEHCRVQAEAAGPGQARGEGNLLQIVHGEVGTLRWGVGRIVDAYRCRRRARPNHSRLAPEPVAGLRANWETAAYALGVSGDFDVRIWSGLR